MAGAGVQGAFLSPDLKACPRSSRTQFRHHSRTQAQFCAPGNWRLNKDGIERYCPLGALERLNKDGMEHSCPLGTLESLNKDKLERFAP